MDKNSSRLCPVCEKMAIMNDEQNYDSFRIQCDTCGTFILEDDVYTLDGTRKLSLIEQACLYYYLTGNRTNTKQKLIPHFHRNANWGEDTSTEQNKHKVIHMNSIISLYPETIESKISMALVNLAAYVKYIGNNFETGIDNDRYYHIFFVDDRYKENGAQEQQFRGLLKILLDDGYIDYVEIPAGKNNLFSLTSKGWMEVAKYQEMNRFIEQGFIAMMFSSEMLLAKEKIITAIRDCGYIAMVIDQKEHNNQIVPEIFYEIRQSQFIVADLTGQRNGVYYEAGYGEALGKAVIVTCRKLEEDDPKPHFDLAQKNTIFWENENDLYRKLKRRIEVTVGCLHKQL